MFSHKRVPSPSFETLSQFTEHELPEISDAERNNIITICGQNLNSLKHLIMLKKKLIAKKNGDICPNIVKNMATMISQEMYNIDNLSEIHTMAERFHMSELCVVDICKHIPNIDACIIEVQKYSSKTCPSLYDTMLLFLDIARIHVRALQ